MVVHLEHSFLCPHKFATLCGLPAEPVAPANFFVAQIVDCPDCRAVRRADGIACCADFTGLPVPHERTGEEGRHVRYR